MSRRIIDWSVPQRQSGAAIFIILVAEIWRLLKVLWPFLLISLLRSRQGADKWDYLVLAISGITIASAILEFFYFRFSIVNGELHIRKGWLARHNIVLPLEKIQAVHIEESWLHTIFHSAKVSFDSSGSETMEVKLHAVEKQKAESLRDFIIGSKARLEDAAGTKTQGREANEPATLITLGTRDLLKLGISSNHLEAFFLLLAFVLSLLDNLEKIMGDLRTGFLRWLVELMQSSTAGLILSMAVALLALSIIISFARILLQYHEFRLSRSVRGFGIRTGLLNIKQKLVPFNKVQYISWSANWVRQQIGLRLLHFHSTGSGLVREKQEVKVPLTRMEFIPSILESYHPLLPVKSLEAVRLHRTYVWRRILIFGFVPGIIITAIAYLAWGPNSFWALLIVPYMALTGFLFRQKFRLWIAAEALQIKKGVFGIEEIVLKWYKIQAVELKQSLYQRRKGLASLTLVTAGGSVSIPFIKYGEARSILDYALYKVESTSENWM